MNISSRSGTGTSATSAEVSLIVSCFNKAEILEAALRDCFSAVRKSVENFEIVVINDGSTDGSVRILDRLRKEFSNLRVTHQLHSGHARSLRRACDIARGEFLFQIDLEDPEWVRDFSLFWEMRERYALITGYHPDRGGLLRRSLRWLQTRWIKFWFSADLVAPESSYRLCRRTLALQYLQQIPKDYEGVNLAMTLLTYRDAPRLLLELEVGKDLKTTRFYVTEELAKILHHFVEVAGLWWKRPTPPTLTPEPSSI